MPDLEINVIFKRGGAPLRNLLAQEVGASASQSQVSPVIQRTESASRSAAAGVVQYSQSLEQLKKSSDTTVAGLAKEGHALDDIQKALVSLGYEAKNVDAIMGRSVVSLQSLTGGKSQKSVLSDQEKATEAQAAALSRADALQLNRQGRTEADTVRRVTRINELLSRQFGTRQLDPAKFLGFSEEQLGTVERKVKNFALKSTETYRNTIALAKGDLAKEALSVGESTGEAINTGLDRATRKPKRPSPFANTTPGRGLSDLIGRGALAAAGRNLAFQAAPELEKFGSSFGVATLFAASGQVPGPLVFAIAGLEAGAAALAKARARLDNERRLSSRALSFDQSFATRDVGRSAVKEGRELSEVTDASLLLMRIGTQDALRFGQSLRDAFQIGISTGEKMSGVIERIHQQFAELPLGTRTQYIEKALSLEAQETPPIERPVLLQRTGEAVVEFVRSNLSPLAQRLGLEGTGKSQDDLDAEQNAAERQVGLARRAGDRIDQAINARAITEQARERVRVFLQETSLGRQQTETNHKLLVGAREQTQELARRNRLVTSRELDPSQQTQVEEREIITRRNQQLRAVDDEVQYRKTRKKQAAEEVAAIEAKIDEEAAAYVEKGLEREREVRSRLAKTDPLFLASKVRSESLQNPARARQELLQSAIGQGLNEAAIAARARAREEESLAAQVAQQRRLLADQIDSETNSAIVEQSLNRLHRARDEYNFQTELNSRLFQDRAATEQELIQIRRNAFGASSRVQTAGEVQGARLRTKEAEAVRDRISTTLAQPGIAREMIQRLQVELEGAKLKVRVAAELQADIERRQNFAAGAPAAERFAEDRRLRAESRRESRGRNRLDAASGQAEFTLERLYGGSSIPKSLGMIDRALEKGFITKSEREAYITRHPNLPGGGVLERGAAESPFSGPAMELSSAGTELRQAAAKLSAVADKLSGSGQGQPYDSPLLHGSFSFDTPPLSLSQEHAL